MELALTKIKVAQDHFHVLQVIKIAVMGHVFHLVKPVIMLWVVLANYSCVEMVNVLTLILKFVKLTLDAHLQSPSSAQMVYV